MDIDDLAKRFTYHAPTEGKPEIYQDIRATALKLAILIDASQDDCREKSLAISYLETAVMWANAGVARSGL